MSSKSYLLALEDFNRQGPAFEVSPQQDHIYPLRLQYLIPSRVHMQSSSCHLYVPVCLPISDTLSFLRFFLNQPIENVLAYAFHLSTMCSTFVMCFTKQSITLCTGFLEKVFQIQYVEPNILKNAKYGQKCCRLSFTFQPSKGLGFVRNGSQTP